MNVRHHMTVLHSFSIKNIFHEKIDLKLFYFHVTKYNHLCKSVQSHMAFRLTYLLEQLVLPVFYFPFCCSIFQIFPVSVPMRHLPILNKWKIVLILGYLNLTSKDIQVLFNKGFNKSKFNQSVKYR